jgi:epoxyqueuosine reductase
MATRNKNKPADRIAAMCLEELRFGLVGFCQAKATSHPGVFGTWLKSGKHGSMEWMTKHTDLRVDPTKLLPGASSAW